MQEILHQISIWIILLPLITGLWLSKKLSHKSLIILFLIIAATPPQLISNFFSKNLRNSFYNVYTIIEFFILYLYFKGRFYSISCKRIFKGTFILYCIISLAILFTSKSISARFISEWVSVNNLFYLLWIVIYFRDQYLLPEMELTFRDPFSWSLLGIFIYAACTSLHFVLYDIIQSSYLSIFQSSFNILLYTLFAISFIKDKMLQPQIKLEY